MKKIIAALLALALVFGLCACGKEAQEDGSLKCKYTISCEGVLDNMDALNPDKVELIPEDGFFFGPEDVAFAEGENAFDILLRVCKDNGIHMEYQADGGYGSAFVEGIANLYGGDCGEMSGWLMSYNGEYPNYGASDIFPVDGDEIIWKFCPDMMAEFQ